MIKKDISKYVTLEGKEVLVRICTKCSRWKPLEEFRKQSKSRLGTTSRCKSCLSVDKGIKKLVALEVKLLDGVDVSGKACTKCDKWSPLDNFHGSKSKGLGGRVSVCKDCRNTKHDKRIKWNEMIILKEMNEILEKYPNATPKLVKELNSSLYVACTKKYGGVSKVINKCGGNAYEYRKFNENDVIEDLRKYYKEEGNFINLSYKNHALYRRAISKFGSVKSALKKLGVGNDGDIWAGFLYEHEIIDYFTDRFKEDKVIVASDVYKENPKMYHAAKRRFRNFHDLANVIGYKYNDYFYNWTEEKILEQIKNRYEAKENLSSTYLEMNDNSLLGAGRRYFGSWEEAVKSAGIEYTSIREDRDTVSYFGKEFEKVVDDILTDLRIPYKKYDHDKWQPDYVFGKDMWGDAKLSQWTSTIYDTIDKYESCCRFLTIFYMRGDTKVDRMISKKTRIVSIDILIKQLPRHKQKIYHSRVSEINKGAKTRVVK